MSQTKGSTHMYGEKQADLNFTDDAENTEGIQILTDWLYGIVSKMMGLRINSEKTNRMRLGSIFEYDSAEQIDIQLRIY